MAAPPPSPRSQPGLQLIQIPDTCSLRAISHLPVACDRVPLLVDSKVEQVKAARRKFTSKMCEFEKTTTIHSHLFFFFFICLSWYLETLKSFCVDFACSHQVLQLIPAGPRHIRHIKLIRNSEWSIGVNERVTGCIDGMLDAVKNTYFPFTGHVPRTDSVHVS